MTRPLPVKSRLPGARGDQLRPAVDELVDVDDPVGVLRDSGSLVAKKAPAVVGHERAALACAIDVAVGR